MIIGIPEGHNVVAGREQGYAGLPMRVCIVRHSLKTGDIMESPAMVTRWMPTKKERALIAAGADVFIRMLGTMPPPLTVGVGDPDTPGHEW